MQGAKYLKSIVILLTLRPDPGLLDKRMKFFEGSKKEREKFHFKSFPGWNIFFVKKRFFNVFRK